MWEQCLLPPGERGPGQVSQGLGQPFLGRTPQAKSICLDSAFPDSTPHPHPAIRADGTGLGAAASLDQACWDGRGGQNPVRLARPLG